MLTLLTASSEGAWCFADSLGQAGRDWTAAWFSERMKKEGPRGEVSLFGEVPVFDPVRYEADNRERWTLTIASNIDKMLTGMGSFKPADHVPEVYGAVLGQAWERHARAAVKRLHPAKVDHDGIGDFWKATLSRP
ncbi:hypothetical protein [Krasilnikovia sp. MM14-A1004]|uniref:hypothetical protein n=1 Tax=Krasilnikovia sp. MM14-A1004 TaxID=3373541 RepID=UPI00399C7816